MFDPSETHAREEGLALTPRFDGAGLLPAVVTDAASGTILMLAWMNAEALGRTIDTGETWFWSRFRQCLWHKGATSGQIQRIEEIRVDCDQDTIWLRVGCLRRRIAATPAVRAASTVAS